MCHTFFYVYTAKELYPGINFYGETLCASITQSAATLQSPDAGICIDIPAGSLSSDEEPVNFEVLPCFSGPFKLPDGYESASPAYLILPSRKVSFIKDITLIIHHYTVLTSEEDCDEMEFFSASLTPQYRNKSPVYTFNHIQGSKGKFKIYGQLGEIQLKHFCAIKTGRKRTRKGTQEIINT